MTKLTIAKTYIKHCNNQKFDLTNSLNQKRVDFGFTLSISSIFFNQRISNDFTIVT